MKRIISCVEKEYKSKIVFDKPFRKKTKNVLRHLSMMMTVMAICLNINAQKLLIDKVDGNGERTMQTNYSKLYTKMTTGASIALGCVVKESDTTYMLCLRLSEYGKTMEKGRKLLIKLDDNSIITLVNVNNIGSSDYNRVGSEYQTFPIYPISKEDLFSIINGEVVKIRIETDIDLIDRDIRGTMSGALREDYNLINKKLKENKTIYSDF